jgi:FMN phosphatase YigB (HAD superfamily)
VDNSPGPVALHLASVSEVRIQLVCFDLGGVVVRTCHSWAEGCRNVGLDVRGDVNAAIAPGWGDLNADYQSGRITHTVFSERFSAMISGLYTAEEVRRVHRAWILGEYDGIGAVVDALHDAGLESAVLSNTCEVHWELLPRYPAFTRLRNRLGSHLLGVRKPDEAAYRAVEEHTGFAGAEIIFFDDRVENIAAARDVGWNAVQIDPLGSTAEQVRAGLVAQGAI